MLPKANGAYTAAQVDAAVAGLNFPPIGRIRAEILDSDNQKLADLARYSTPAASNHLIARGSRIFHKHDVDIQRACELLIREADLELDAFSEIVVGASPLFYLRLGEASGATAADASGNGRSFAYNGGVTYSSGSLLAGDTANTAIKLNGSTGYLSVADAAWMDVSRFTLMIWRNGTSNTRALINRDDGTNRFFSLEVNASGYITLTLTFTGPATTTFTAMGAVNDGRAYSIIASYDGAYVKIYANGKRLLKTAETRTLITGALGINIGRSQAGAGTLYDDATFDEVAMFDRALTPAEIREIDKAGRADLAEVDYTSDRIKVYYGIGMVEKPDPETDTDWAEYAQIVAVLTSPTRDQDEFGIFRRVTGHDQTRLLVDGSFSVRWTTVAGANYITGANGILAICQLAGLNTTGWAITSTAKTLPTTLDFVIGSSYLEAINYLLVAINYKNIRFRGDGQGVIEPAVLVSSRQPEDSMGTDDAYKIIGATRLQQAIEISKVPNTVVLTKPNPDDPTIVSVQTNLALLSDTSVPNTGIENVFKEQVEVADQATLDALAKEKLTRFSQGRSTLNDFFTAPRPFHDDDDVYHIKHVTTDDFDNALEIDGNFNELEWELSLDPTELMRHVMREVVVVTS